MEKYINEDTIIKNDTYNSYTELIICQICQCIMIEPVMCVDCQNYYCKKCIDDWKKKSEFCPNRCKGPIYKNVIEKNRLITKMKFKCIKGCGAEILFDDIKKHYSTNCLENKKEINNIINNRKGKSNIKNGKSNIKKLSKKEVSELLRSKKYTKKDYFTSNYISLFIFYFIVITLGDTTVGKTSLINT